MGSNSRSLRPSAWRSNRRAIKIVGALNGNRQSETSPKRTAGYRSGSVPPLLFPVPAPTKDSAQGAASVGPGRAQSSPTVTSARQISSIAGGGGAADPAPALGTSIARAMPLCRASLNTAVVSSASVNV